MKGGEHYPTARAGCCWKAAQALAVGTGNCGKSAATTEALVTIGQTIEAQRFTKWRWGRINRALSVLLVRVSRGCWRSRFRFARKVPGRVRWRNDFIVRSGAIHGNQDRRSFEELDLLVLGDEQLGGQRPFGSVFPPTVSC